MHRVSGGAPSSPVFCNSFRKMATMSFRVFHAYQRYQTSSTDSEISNGWARAVPDRHLSVSPSWLVTMVTAVPGRNSRYL